MLMTKESKQRQSGFGLVEILIALLLGTLLTTAMVQIYLSSKQAYRTQDALSRIQENGRYVMEVLGRDIRMAGFQGCGNLDNVFATVVVSGISGSGTFGAGDTLRGLNDVTGDVDVEGSVINASLTTLEETATDVITINRADDCGAYLSVAINDPSADIVLNDGNSCDFEQDDLALISDCSQLVLFRVTNDPGGEPTQLSHALLPNPFGADARVYKFVQRDYFIRDNAFGEPSLFRRENGNTVELVEGVSDLQIQYGEDTNGDFFVDRYVDADVAGPAIDWESVTSVRPVLTLRSLTTEIEIVNEADDEDRMIQTMTSTIGLRNRLP